MAFLKRAVLLLTLLGVLSSPAFAASVSLRVDDRPSFVPSREVDGYFVSNRHPLPPGQDTEYLYIDSYDPFDRLFGLATVMGTDPDVVDEAFFRDKAVLAIIRGGLWDMKLDSVTRGAGGIEVSYFAKRVPAEFEAVTPLLVAIPKEAGGQLYRFVENGEAVHILTTDDIQSAQRDNPGLRVAGGWTDFHEVDDDAARLLGRALGGIVGARYDPIGHATQVVNGVNHRFICEQTLTTMPPRKGVVVISFHEGLDGRLSEPNIQQLIQ